MYFKEVEKFMNLSFIMYKSEKTVKPVNFYFYNITVTQENGAYPVNKPETMRIIARSIVRKLNIPGNLADVLATYTDKGIFTRKKIDAHKFDSFIKIDGITFSYKLDYSHEEMLPVVDYKTVYADVIKMIFMSNLDGHKSHVHDGIYEVANDEILNSYVDCPAYNNNIRFYSARTLHVCMKRAYRITVEIRADLHAYISVEISTKYEGVKRINNIIEDNNYSIIGLECKYKWDSLMRGTVIIDGISSHTVAEKSFNNMSLKEFFLNGKFKDNEKMKKMINSIPDNTPAILCHYKKESSNLFYPQALLPVYTSEQVKKFEPKFLAENQIKAVWCNMQQRIASSNVMIQDAGIVKFDGNEINFPIRCITAGELGYKSIILKKPMLATQEHCSSSEENKKVIFPCWQKKRLFEVGFYDYPKIDKINVGIYCDNNIELKYIIIFKYLLYKMFLESHNLEKTLSYDIQNSNAIINNNNFITIEKKCEALKHLIEVKGCNCIITICGNDNETYKKIKQYLYNYEGNGVAAQNISHDNFIDFMDKYMRSLKNRNMTRTSDFFYSKLSFNDVPEAVYNIIMGIWCKMGGITFILDKPLPKNIDLIIGIDVARPEAKISYPCGAAAMDGQGRSIGFYIPVSAQKGEKISKKNLNDIFLSYTEAFMKKNKGNLPRTVLIIRDGISFESDTAYKDFFGIRNINYIIIDVRKSGGQRIADTSNENFNPKDGVCVVKNSSESIIVTTSRGKNSAPNPINIKVVTDNCSIEEASQIIYALTKNHVGTFNSCRLPSAQYFADLCCKSREILPVGRIFEYLYFL